MANMAGFTADKHSSVGESDTDFPPGTVMLEDGSTDAIYMIPMPSSDPNEPLNWTKFRKAWNFGLVAAYTFAVYAIVSIATTLWQDYVDELGVTFDQLNIVLASEFAGITVGCVIFIPLAFKFGRRPIYLVSGLLTLASAIWQAEQRDLGNMLAANVLTGFGSSPSEIIVQITVSDLFFVHERGAMNGVFQLATTAANFLPPIAAGYAAESIGWRWVWWVVSMMLGAIFIIFVFSYEETRYAPAEINSQQRPQHASRDTHSIPPVESNTESTASIVKGLIRTTAIDATIPMNNWRTRLAPWTISPGGLGLFLRHVYQPFLVTFTLPAAACNSIINAAGVAWTNVLVANMATNFSLPPYNFGTADIGLSMLALLIGGIFGAFYGGYLSDRMIVWRSKRNNGVFEPEMRLYLSLFPAILMPLSIWMYGISIANQTAWIVPLLGLGIYTAALTAIGSLNTTYIMDCYVAVIGDIFVGNICIRSAFSAAIIYALPSWLAAMGTRSTFILLGFLSLIVNGLIVVMVVWGKQFRRMTSKRYKKLALLQFNAQSGRSGED